MTKTFSVKNVTEMLEQVAAMIPNAEERARMTNEKIVSSLKKIGIATREEVETLEARVAALEGELNERPARTTKAKMTEKPNDTTEHA